MNSGKLKLTISKPEAKNKLVKTFKKISPPTTKSQNDVNSSLMSTYKRSAKLLNEKVDYVVIHGTATAIPKAIRVANMLNEAMKHSVKLDIRTGTVVGATKIAKDRCRRSTSVFDAYVTLNDLYFFI